MIKRYLKRLKIWFLINKTRIINDKDVDYYIKEIKKQLYNSDKRVIKMWLPSKMENEINKRLIKDMDFDLAFLRSDNNGFCLYYISKVVRYEEIRKRIDQESKKKKCDTEYNTCKGMF